MTATHMLLVIWDLFNIFVLFLIEMNVFFLIFENFYDDDDNNNNIMMFKCLDLSHLVFSPAVSLNVLLIYWDGLKHLPDWKHQALNPHSPATEAEAISTRLSSQRDQETIPKEVVVETTHLPIILTSHLFKQKSCYKRIVKYCKSNILSSLSRSSPLSLN